jgi:hypothetical protein
MGLAILALGIVLAIWGLINLLAVRNWTVLTVQALLSLLPALLGAWAIQRAMSTFLVMAVAEQAPKPSDMAKVISFGMVCGLWATLGTALSAGLGILALAKRRKAEPSVE